jgi:hypothetical protein
MVCSISACSWSVGACMRSNPCLEAVLAELRAAGVGDSSPSPRPPASSGSVVCQRHHAGGRPGGDGVTNAEHPAGSLGGTRRCPPTAAPRREDPAPGRRRKVRRRREQQHASIGQPANGENRWQRRVVHSRRLSRGAAMRPTIQQFAAERSELVAHLRRLARSNGGESV